MAICTYHIEDDVVVISSVVRMAPPTYQIHAKDIQPVWKVATRKHELLSKVLFFR